MLDFTSPYSNLDGFRPYRASLHNHTFKRRPTASPVAALSLYRLCGIPIVAITDHDRRMPQGKPPGEGMVPWVEEDFTNPYDDAVLIRGFEATFPEDHVNVLGCQPEQLSLAPSDPGYVRAVQALNGLAVVNHPARWNDRPEHVIGNANLSVCNGLEIYNGGQSARGLEKAEAASLWDACLSAGLRMWGLANSDCHLYDFSVAGHPRNGWNVLWLPTLDEATVFEALREGRFYATNGLEVTRHVHADGWLRIESPEADRIRFTGAGGRLLQDSAGPTAEYVLTGGEGYVRATCEADRPAYPGASVPLRAWLQPVWEAG